MASSLPVLLLLVLLLNLHASAVPRNKLFSAPHRNALLTVPAVATITSSVDIYHADNLSINFTKVLPEFNSTDVVLACSDPHLLIAPKPYWLLVAIVLVQCVVRSLLSGGREWKNALLRKCAAVFWHLTTIVFPILLTVGQIIATAYALWDEPVSGWCKYQLIFYSALMTITSLAYFPVVRQTMGDSDDIVEDGSRESAAQSSKEMVKFSWGLLLYFIAFGAPYATHMVPMMVLYCWLYATAFLACKGVLMLLFFVKLCLEEHLERKRLPGWSKLALDTSYYYATQFYQDPKGYIYYIKKDYEERTTAKYWARIHNNLPSRIDFFGVVISIVL
ncbi:hypothetical protein HK101_002372 [Irineochytrium annulatum]|nr:hypothetical protein HK101_002372 [Irineochytrium annulatum]